MTIQQLHNGAGRFLIDAINIRTHPHGYIAEVVINSVPHPLNRQDSGHPLVFASIHDIKSRLGDTHAIEVNLITDNGISQV
ncbi:hypothetical protein [Aestuariirhabdus litorea]|uniref:Uncharacterized protein n=1 Tax=Aestuariirhabdus litorea TaxID=2528527 RepID=A0A3P3VS35_9GAMM|nr:hypothetical protein [Aestuariirhabdus litorea]RRJ84319.1 hypothetical protein D0544_04210 [Aestuariirhabdus litorea]RWW97542.1 hypothetical protein DZC74_04210 [Endozoicomonadaceae bacterium GTF-13]